MNKIEVIGSIQNTQSNLLWNITSCCNFKCDYCQNKLQHKKVDIKILPILNDLDNKFYLYLYGGEPTICDNFYNILDSINRDKLGLYTNLFINPIEYIKCNKITKIIASFHKSFMNENKFTEHLKVLRSNNVKFTCNIMLENRYIDDIITYYNYLIKIFGNKFINLRVINNYKYDKLDFVKSLSKELIHTYYKINNEIKYDNKITFSKCLCDIPNHLLFLDNDGNITTPCFKQKIANLFHDKKVYTKAVLCRNKCCCVPLLYTGNKIIL